MAAQSGWRSPISLFSAFFHDVLPAVSLEAPASMEGPAPEQAGASAAAPHISATGSITQHHLAFEYLRDMRARGALGAQVIDEDGNFFSSSAQDSEGNAAGGRADKSGSAGPWRGTLFEPHWEQEFQEVEYQLDVFPKWLTMAFLFGGQACLTWMVAALGSQPEHCPVNSPFRFGVYGRLLVGLPCIMLVSTSAVVRLSLPYIPKKKRTKLYPTLVLVWATALHAVFVYIGLSRELIRGLGGPPVAEGMCAQISHIEVHIDYRSGWFPTRTCIDHDPRKTVREWPFVTHSGCESMIPDATIPRAIEFAFALCYLRCTARTALTFVLVSTSILALACVASCGLVWWLVPPLSLHLLCGAVVSYLCFLRTQHAKDQFAKVKRIKIAAKNIQKLLHTLIPPNVLARLALHSHDMGILATDIPDCTIMFCCLAESAHDQGNQGKPASRPRSIGRISSLKDHDVAEFQRLHALYFDFDAAVQNTALYKYQHVGPWYIIACPNAAEPFDSHTSSASRAPGKDGTGRGSVDAKGARGRRGRSYATEMAELAQRLVRVAGQHGVQLQVGIHTGSAAGAVLGTLRAFYCIYGDTVNISSRLCKAAEPCQIHCSAAFVRLLQLERTLSSHVSADAEHTMSVNTMSVRSRGHVLLKGLPESMETFVVLCENNGQEERERDGRLATSEEGRAVNVNAFNVDAFTGADALAAASGKQASTGGEGKAGSVRKEALLEDPYMSLLHYSHLSTESRAMMLDKSIGFRLYDAALDKEHLEEYKEQATEQLNEQAISCIAYHFMGVVFQLVQVLYTVHTYDSSVLGPELAASHLTLSRLLHLHAAIQLVLSVVLVIAFRRCRVEWSQRARMLLAILRIAWLVMCIYASSAWPMAAYTVCFSALFNTSQSLIWLGSFRNMALLYCLVNVLVIMLLFSARHLITSAFISRWLCSSISTWMFVVWAEEDNRRSWRLHHVFSTEMKRLDNILNDLLPLNLDAQEHFPGTAVVLNAQPNQNPSEGSLWTRRRYSSNLLSGINTGQKREALVLQLDLCHFTQLSRSISAMHLAQALHELFSAFDTAVQHLGLFKVDTVGDAFIVAAWLPPNALSPRAARVVHSSQTMIDLECARKDAEETGQICSKILWLASTMLDAVDACRIASCPSQRVTARIGIGAGKVVVGALGSLQPRMHIRGDAAKEAEELEATGRPGSIHVCDTVLDLMAHASSSSSSLPAGLHHEHAAAGDQQAGQRASGDAQDRLQARQEDWLQAPTLRRRRTGSVGCVSHDGMLGLSSASHARSRRVSEVTHESHIDNSFGGTWHHMKAAAEGAKTQDAEAHGRVHEEERDDAAAAEATEQLKRAASNVLAQTELQLKVVGVMRNNKLQKLQTSTNLEHGRFVNAHSSNPLASRVSFILDRSKLAVSS